MRMILTETTPETHGGIEIERGDLFLIADGLALLEPLDDDEDRQSALQVRCERLAAQFRAMGRTGAREVEYRSSDIGYGVESGSVVGVWGKRDCWGKRELVPIVPGEPTLYLFDDEVVSDTPAVRA